jgi:hypothetical protein
MKDINALQPDGGSVIELLESGTQRCAPIRGDAARNQG